MHFMWLVETSMVWQIFQTVIRSKERRSPQSGGWCRWQRLGDGMWYNRRVGHMLSTSAGTSAGPLATGTTTGGRTAARDVAGQAAAPLAVALATALQWADRATVGVDQCQRLGPRRVPKKVLEFKQLLYHSLLHIVWICFPCLYFLSRWVIVSLNSIYPLNDLICEKQNFLAQLW